MKLTSITVHVYISSSIPFLYFLSWFKLVNFIYKYSNAFKSYILLLFMFSYCLYPNVGVGMYVLHILPTLYYMGCRYLCSGVCLNILF